MGRSLSTPRSRHASNRTACLAAAAAILVAGDAPAEGLLDAACAPGQKLIVRDYKDHPANRTARGHDMAAFVRGKNGAGVDSDHLMLVWSQDSGKGDGGISFYNWDNPASWTAPKLRKHWPQSQLREAHGTSVTNMFAGDWRTWVLQATTGFSVVDLDSVVAPKLVANYTITGAAKGGQGSAAACSGGCAASYDAAARDYSEGAVWFLGLAAPYLYVAQSDNGLNIYRFTNAGNAGQIAWVKRLDKSWFGHRVNQVWVMGNLLVATTGQLNYGVTFLDISDPANPVKRGSYGLGTSPSTREVYSWTLNGRRLYGAARFKYRLNDPGLQVYALNGSGFAMSYVGGVRGACGAGGYVALQDRFAHVGLSTCYQKFDVNSLSPASPTNPPWGIGITGADNDFTTPFGNAVWIGNDHQAKPGSAILCHAAARDTNRPEVNGQMPPKGSSGVKVTTGVGLSFTDNLKHWTVGTGTLPIRRNGTSTPVAGYYSYQLNIVNFRPARTLDRGTTYNVVMNAGVQDLAGNGASGYSGSFQTASALNSAAWHDPDRRQWAVRADLQPGATLFGGSPARAVHVPEPLLARTWISPDAAAGDRDGAQPLLSLDLAEPAQVHVCHDDRDPAPPAWLADWADSGDGIGVEEDGQRWAMRCRQRPFEPGEISLGGPDGAPRPYLVVLAPPVSEPARLAEVSVPFATAPAASRR